MASPSFFICILLHINYKLFFFFLQYFLAKLFNFFIIHSKKTGSSVKFPVFFAFLFLGNLLEQPYDKSKHCKDNHKLPCVCQENEYRPKKEQWSQWWNQTCKYHAANKHPECIHNFSPLFLQKFLVIYYHSYIHYNIFLCNFQVLIFLYTFL